MATGTGVNVGVGVGTGVLVGANSTDAVGEGDTLSGTARAVAVISATTVARISASDIDSGCSAGCEQECKGRR